MKNKKSTLGLVIVDGVGFRNFILSSFLEEAQLRFNKIVIFSGLPASVYGNFELRNCVIEELDDFREPGKTWFFRKLKENAHLQNNKKDNFGIQDNLKTTYSLSKSRRGKLTRLIFKWGKYFHSENWITKYYGLQQQTFKNHPGTKKYRALIKKYEPEILFFTHQRPPYIAPLIFAAETEKIKTCSFIFSWDNLASKGRMAGDFDHYFVWSDLMKSELLEFYRKIGKNQIEVVGTPQFEPYVMDRYRSEREFFLQKFNLDPAKKTICFSCGDASTSKNDPLYIKTIATAIFQDKLAEKVNFLVRTSPAEEPKRFEDLKEEFPFIKWNYPKWELAREDHSEIWSQRVPTIEDIKDLRMILEFSDLGINMCSTMSLDFMVFDKPVINPVFGNEENGLYDDQRFLKYAHYERVVKSKAVFIAKNEKELVREINEGLDHPENRKDERQQLFSLQVGKPLEGTGKRIAETLKELV